MVKCFNQKTSHSRKGRSRRESARSERQTSRGGKILRNQTKWFYFFFFFLVLLLGLAQVLLSNKLATRGRKLTLSEKEISLTEEKNKSLKTEIAALGCFSKLNLIASEKGFIKNPPIVNLSTKVPVALKSR